MTTQDVLSNRLVVLLPVCGTTPVEPLGSSEAVHGFTACLLGSMSELGR